MEIWLENGLAAGRITCPVAPAPGQYVLAQPQEGSQEALPAALFAGGEAADRPHGPPGDHDPDEKDQEGRDDLAADQSAAGCKYHRYQYSGQLRPDIDAADYEQGDDAAKEARQAVQIEHAAGIDLFGELRKPCLNNCKAECGDDPGHETDGKSGPWNGQVTG